MADLETRSDSAGSHDGDSGADLRYIMDAAPVLISYIDPDFHYRFVNQGYADWFGRPVEELQNRHVRDAVGAAAFDKVRHHLEMALSGERVTYEAAMPYENGPHRFVHTQLVPDRRGGSAIYGIVAVITDVSARKVIEDRLEESEQRYRSLFEQNIDAVFSCDLSGRFTSVNAACETFTGYSPAELLSHPFLPLIVPEYRPQTIRHFQRARQGESQTYETALRQKSGTKTDISVTNIPIIVGGDVVGVYGIAKDIAARKRRERRQQFLLRLSERTRLITDRDALLKETLNSVGAFLRLSRVWFADVNALGKITTVQQEWRSEDAPAAVLPDVLPVEWGEPVIRELAAGRPLIISDLQTDIRTAGDWESLYREIGVVSCYTRPLLRGGQWAAVLNAEIHGDPRIWSLEDSELLENVTQRLWVALEHLRVSQSEQESALNQRKFLREMLSSLTEGRLQLCNEPADLPPPLPAASPTLELSRSSLRILRRQVEAVANRLNLPLDHRQDLVTAVGEAGMNAVVHGVGGWGRVHADAAASTIQVWIGDSGRGISQEALPYALEIGKSSAGSLGHGFWLMLKTADRIWLLTGARGTTVVLEQEKTAPEPAWMKGLGKTP